MKYNVQKRTSVLNFWFVKNNSLFDQNTWILYNANIYGFNMPCVKLSRFALVKIFHILNVHLSNIDLTFCHLLSVKEI